MIVLLSINLSKIICLAIGIIGIIFTLKLLIESSKSLKKIDENNYVPVMATIIDNKRNKDGAYAAVYKFKCDSTEHISVGTYSSLTPYNIGAQVEIKVDPKNPNMNSVKANVSRNLMLTIILVLLMISAFFLLLGFNIT